jgi:hypothetical protein
VSSFEIGETQAEHLASLMDGVRLVDQCVKQLIIDELADMQFPLEENLEKAARRLSQAVEALMGPQAAIADLERDISRAEAKCAAFRGQLESGSPDRRAPARSRLAEWEAERDATQAKKRQAEADMVPLVHEWEQAKENMKTAQEMLDGLLVNMLDPYRGLVGQSTSAYQIYRKQAGHLISMGLAGDFDNPEWPQLISLCELLCAHSGYRTDGSSGHRPLPTNAEQLANVLSELQGQPEIAPSGAEVMAQAEAVAENAKLQREIQYIEDYRDPRPPRELQEREYMQVQRLRDFR